MSKFLLRLPTTKDIEKMSVNLDHMHRAQLLSVYVDSTPHVSFHVSDGPYSTKRKEAYFRPVLEASEDIELNALLDNQTVSMGDITVLGYKLYSLTQTASWIKCGNLLIAEAATPYRIPYSELEAKGLVAGIEVDMPFEREVTMDYYRQFMSQPTSALRRIAETMQDLRRSTDNPRTGESRLTDEQVYTIAQKIDHCWLHTDFSLDDVTDAASELITDGIEYLTWRDNGNTYEESFSGEACRDVLCACDQAVFKTLIEIHQNSIILNEMMDRSGNPTSQFFTLTALQNAEANLSEAALNEKLHSLDDRIKDASVRAGAISHDKPAPQLEK